MGVSIDRLDSLPDSLLATIVSSLPFKEAVKTSILSKKWLNISKSTSNIDFNEMFFVKIDEPKEIVKAQRKAFFDFTNYWIDNHKETSVDKFSLRLTMPNISVEVIDRCTAFATKNGVKDLQLDFTSLTCNQNYNFFYDVHEASVELPLHVYENDGLKYLKLFSCNFIDTHLHNFHSLKEVYLGYMSVKMSAIKALLLSCKMLESLTLLRCFSSENFDLGEEFLGLRKLVIDKCNIKFDVFKVNAPNLKIFKYCGLMTLFTIEIRALAMEEVELDFSREFGCQGHGPYLYRFVEELYTSRVLIVCSYLLQVIPMGGRPERMYCNMKAKHLIMKTALHENEFIGITFLLNSCPFLECLTIEMGLEKRLLGFERRVGFNIERFWIDNVRVYICVRLNLKKVEFKGFTGTINELCFLSYLIVRGKVLEKISIDILKDEVVDNESTMVYRRAYRHAMAKMLLNLPKASNDLEISIY